MLDVTPSDLAVIGQFLYGERWQSALARDLNVNRRTLVHWLTGRYHPNPGAVDDIITLTAAELVQREVLRAAESGLWGKGALTITHKDHGWSDETDRHIKQRMALQLAEYGIPVKVAER